jgi:hypothetical protein
MEKDAPQVPVTQKVQPGAKEVFQTPQQTPADSQAPPPPAGGSTPPPKPKIKRKTILIVFIVLATSLVILGVVGYYFYKSSQKSATGTKIGTEWFQIGNTQPTTQLQLKKSEELEDNRMGDMYTIQKDIFIEGPETSENPDDFANRINEMGLKWMRVSIDVFDWIEVKDTSYSKHNVYPEQDRAITALNNNGINVMHTLVFWDEELPVKQGASYSRYKTEDEIQRYLDYVQFVVSHFKGRVKYYELLNELDIGKGEGDQQYVESSDYINLIERAVPVIRQEDPQAKIVIGAVSPFAEPGTREYFFKILNSDALLLVDGISWHFGAGSSPEYMAEYYYSYPALVQEIKDTISANGFTGECIAEELHWRTSETAHPSEYDEYTEISAAKYLARSVVMILGKDCAAGLAASNEMQINMTQNLATIIAGAKPVDLSLVIGSEATNIKNYNFFLPNGDKLVALWTDGVSVENDSGVKADLTLESIAADEVVAIDIFSGLQQPLVIEEGTIKNLIVRDYPLMLSITE